MNDNNIRRIYPIRTTRRKWDIKLYKYHNCTEYCNIVFTIDNEYPDQILIINNSKYINGRCERYNKVEDTIIRLTDFDSTNSTIGIYGKLYNSDTIVVPDNSFSIHLYYPLSNIFEIVVKSNINNGFTLKDIINNIKILYEYIYEEEENTSTPQVYNLKKICSNCTSKDFDKYLEDIDPPVTIECCICFNTYEQTDSVSKLKCSHIFHKNCIKTWLNKAGTCPICRSNVFECKTCDGSGIISYQYTGTVIPMNERGTNMNRNRTNGVFGIHSCDLEDLVLESLKYDRIKKRLDINIVS